MWSSWFPCTLEDHLSHAVVFTYTDCSVTNSTLTGKRVNGPFRKKSCSFFVRSHTPAWWRFFAKFSRSPRRWACLLVNIFPLVGRCNPSNYMGFIVYAGRVNCRHRMSHSKNSNGLRSHKVRGDFRWESLVAFYVQLSKTPLIFIETELAWQNFFEFAVQYAI